MRSDSEIGARRIASMLVLDSLEPLASMPFVQDDAAGCQHSRLYRQLSLNAGGRDSWVDRRAKVVERRLRILVVRARVKVRSCPL